jgi:uncharacterized membrane protein
MHYKKILWALLSLTFLLLAAYPGEAGALQDPHLMDIEASPSPSFNLSGVTSTEEDGTDPLSSDIWLVLTKDSSGTETGQYPSIALDENDNLHISYQYVADSVSYLKYYYSTDSGSGYKTFDPAYGDAMYTSLALDDEGWPHISFYNSDQNTLMYTHQHTNGAFFEPQRVDSSGGYGYVGENGAAIAWGPNNFPVFSFYHDNPSGDKALKLAYMGSAYPNYNWTIIDGGLDTGQYSSVAVDPDGFIHISYFDAANLKLRYAKYKLGEQYASLYSPDKKTPYSGAHTAIALDSLNHPHITHWDWLNRRLKYTYMDANGEWQTETVDTTGDAGEYSSIAIDRGNKPHISYYHNYMTSDRVEHGELWYAYKDSNGVWQRGIVDDSSTIAGIDNDIALDSKDQPHIAYYALDESGEGVLKYAYLTRNVPEVNDLIGETGCKPGDPYCNLCAANLVDSFKSLRSYGDILGFRLDGSPKPAREPLAVINHHHWQGAARLNSGGGNYLVTTLDFRDDPWPFTDIFNFKIKTYIEYSMFSVAELASRNTEGERLRSNVLFQPWDFDDTAAPSEDKVVNYEVISKIGKHPGGIQVMGNIMVIPFDDGEDPDKPVYFYDMNDPKNPEQVLVFEPQKVAGIDDDRGYGSAALAQLSDGRFLLAMYSNKGSIDFFVSNQSDVFDRNITFSLLDIWPKNEIIGNWDNYQGINFVTDCGTGQLYLVGTGNVDASVYLCPLYNWKFPCTPTGWDAASLMEVRFDGNDIELEVVWENIFHCSYRDEKYCNFDAGAGVYVDPDHQLFVYATEHANNGPGGTVKMMEFRPAYFHSCTDINDAWVELFEGYNSYSRNLMIDYQDYNLEYYADFKYPENFTDKTRYAEFCIPNDYSFILYEHDQFRGKQIHLTGNGALQSYTFPKKDPLKVSSGIYVYDPPRYKVFSPGSSTTLTYLYPPRPSSQSALDSPIPTSTLASHMAVAGEPGITLSIPDNLLTDSITLTLAYKSPPSQPFTDTVPTGIGFELGLSGAGYSDPNTKFDGIVVYDIVFDEATMDGFDWYTIDLHHWDVENGRWETAGDTCVGRSPGSLLGTTDTFTYTGGLCQTGEYALVAEPLPVEVLVDEVHDNLLSLDWTRAQEIADTIGYASFPSWFHLGDLQDALTDTFNLSRHNQGELTLETLENAQVLIIPNYRDALSSDEVKAVRQYVARGGGLVLLGDCAFYNPNPELSAAFGVQFEPECLFGPLPEHNGNITVTMLGAHSAVGGLQSFDLNWSQRLGTSGGAESVALTPDDTWQDTNGSDAYESDDDEEGVFGVAVAFDDGCGRVVALGDNAFTNTTLSEDNGELMRSVLEWVSSGEACPDRAVEEPLPVLVDENHDNQKTLDWTRAQALADEWGEDAEPEWAYLGALSQHLSADYNLLPHDEGLITLDLLQQYAALLIPYYYEAYTPAEIKALQEYVHQGGGVILLGDCGFENPNPEWLADYGIELINSCLFTPPDVVQGEVEIYNFADHPSVRGVPSYINNWGQILDISGEALGLMNTSYSSDTWIELSDGTKYYSTEVGPFAVGAAYDDGCGRVVVLGDETFSDADLNWTDNDILMRALLDWVTDASACHQHVLVDESHDNRLTLNWDRAEEIIANQGWGQNDAYLMSAIPDRLQDQFTFHRYTSGPWTAEQLSDYDVLVIPWYLDPLSAAEVSAVHRYLVSGGGLLLIGDSAFDNPNPELASTYGIEFDVHTLFAPLSGGTDLFAINSIAGGSPLVNLENFTWNNGQTLVLSGGAEWWADTYNHDTWRDKDWDGVYTASIDEAGNFDVIGGFDTGCGRVAAIADDSFADRFMDWTQNDKLFQAVLEWVATGRDCSDKLELYLPAIWNGSLPH